MAGCGIGPSPSCRRGTPFRKTGAAIAKRPVAEPRAVVTICVDRVQHSNLSRHHLERGPTLGATPRTLSITSSRHKSGGGRSAQWPPSLRKVAPLTPLPRPPRSGTWHPSLHYLAPLVP